MNPRDLITEFNSVAGVPGYPAGAFQREYRRAPTPRERGPITPETLMGGGEWLYGQTAAALWAKHGLGAKEFTEIIEALPADKQARLMRNTESLLERDGTFAEVMQDMAQNRKKNLGKMIEAIAELPAGMELITTVYDRVSTEQNADVWREFQETAEPAFYDHLLKNHRQELIDAGICAYGISCMERGVAPTTEQGIPYNVDVDHIVERAGGGRMSTEKSIDPDGDGKMPTYAINHISNLCLIMREKHVEKNRINNYQSLPQDEGQKKLMCMAISDGKHSRVLLDRSMLQAAEVSAPETVYFAQGASLLLTRALNETKGDFKITPENAPDIYRMFFKERFEHTLKVWEHSAHVLKTEVDGGGLKQSEIKRISESCDNYLKPLVKAFAESGLPAEQCAKINNVSQQMDALLIKALKDKEGASSQAPAGKQKNNNGQKHGNA